MKKRKVTKSGYMNVRTSKKLKILSIHNHKNVTIGKKAEKILCEMKKRKGDVYVL